MFRLRQDLRGVRSQMRGLNSATSSYTRLKRTEAQMILELEQLGAKKLA